MNPNAKIDDMVASLNKLSANNSGKIPVGPHDAEIGLLVKSKIVGLLSLNELSDLQAAILKTLLEYQASTKGG